MIITLRKWKPEDLHALVKYANNPRIACFLTDMFPHPYLKSDGKAFIEYAANNTENHIFAIDVNQEAIGSIGIHPQKDIHCKNAELGYWLAEPYWGKGITSVAIRQIVEFAFSHQPIERIFARPFGTNIASQRVLEKNGFILEARFHNTLFKNGMYYDELVYARRKP